MYTCLNIISGHYHLTAQYEGGGGVEETRQYNQIVLIDSLSLFCSIFDKISEGGFKNILMIQIKSLTYL